MAVRCQRLLFFLYHYVLSRHFVHHGASAARSARIPAPSKRRPARTCRRKSVFSQPVRHGRTPPHERPLWRRRRLLFQRRSLSGVRESGHQICNSRRKSRRKNCRAGEPWSSACPSVPLIPGKRLTRPSVFLLLIFLLFFLCIGLGLVVLLGIFGSLRVLGLFRFFRRAVAVGRRGRGRSRGRRAFLA